MRLPKFEYFRPRTTEEACSLLAHLRKEAKVLAGGTALVVDMRQRLVSPRYVISLKGIAGLNGIQYDDQQGLRIGALTTLHSLKNSSLIKEKYNILCQASEELGIPALHHVATNGGNLCLDTRCIYYNQSAFWRSIRLPCFKNGGQLCHAVKGSGHCFAVYQGDLAPALLALEAKVKLVHLRGERVIPLAQFFTRKGESPNCLEPNEILAEVQIPPASEHSTGAYGKLRIRGAIDFPLAGVALVLDMKEDKLCSKAKIVLGAIASAPIEATEAEKVLTGKTINEVTLEEAAQEAVKAAHPIANLSLDMAYRRTMIGVLLKRAVRRALELAKPK